jgi:hypothetical protein
MVVSRILAINTTPEKTQMEQAHTRLIEQLNERIAAPDNTPLYLKFAETVKNAVRSGVLEHGIFCRANAI